MKNKRFVSLLACLHLIVLCFFSCKNTYNSLIPNNEQTIKEFSVLSQDYFLKSISAEIKNTDITVKVVGDTDVAHLLPRAVVAKQATLFPLTLRYFQEAFPNTDILDIALKMDINPEQKSLENWFLDLYEQNPDFSIPPLVFPINFFSPVKFAVIGGQGGIEIYTVEVVREKEDVPEPEDDIPAPEDDTLDPIFGDISEPNLFLGSKKILSFNVPKVQLGESVITDDTVSFECKTGTDVRALIPEVKVDEGGVFVPLTREYIFDVCTQLGIDPFTFVQGYMQAEDKKTYIRQALASSDTSNLSVRIDKEIDFTDPIRAIVLGKKDKSLRLYVITANVSETDAFLSELAFTKAKNQSLMKDGYARIVQEQKVAMVTLYYPYEHESLDKPFHLFIDAKFTGEKISVEYNGDTYSLDDDIPFKPVKSSMELHLIGKASAKIHVENKGAVKTYTLRIIFREDPDTIRSITDFRFETFWNSKIKTTSIASIINRDDVGTIKATVLYSGEDRPERLIPSFITGGGRVYVQNVEQVSKASEQDFSTSLAYLCVSKDGNFERLYTVDVEFIKIESSKVELKSFKFSQILNEKISQDAIGVIDEERGTVSVDVIHSELDAPFELIAEFSATGRVSIQGITQTSGFSTQSYKYDVYLKVTAFDDENASKTYRVHVRTKYSTENNCALWRFYFAKKDNPDLSQDVEGYISKYSYDVYALLPSGANLNRLIPSFEADGIVKVQGLKQTSGISSQDFTLPIDYVVVSVNGQNSRTYKVRVQAVGNIIFLNSEARGRNNGTTWKDAFKRIEDAIEACNKSNSENVEIWTTTSTAFNSLEIKFNKAVTIRGGFEGVESKKEKRLGNKQTVFVDVNFKSLEERKIKGNFVFDNIRIIYTNTEPMLDLSWDKEAWSENSITFEGCNVVSSNLNVMFGHIKSLKIKDSVFEKDAKIEIDSLEINDSNFEVHIESSKLHSKIACDKEKEHILDVLKIEKSELSSGNELVASCVEFNDVKIVENEGEIVISNVIEKAIFEHTKINKLSFVANKKTKLGNFSFLDSEIPFLKFEYIEPYTDFPVRIGDVELKRCKNISKIQAVCNTYVNVDRPRDPVFIESFSIEDSEGSNGKYYEYRCDLKELDFAVSALKVKIKNTQFDGVMFVHNVTGRSKPSEMPPFYAEIKDSNIFHLLLNNNLDDGISGVGKVPPPFFHESKGVLAIEDSSFTTLCVGGGEEIVAKNLCIRKIACFYNARPINEFMANIENKKIILDNIGGDKGGRYELSCTSSTITARGLKDCEEAYFGGLKLVDVRSCDFTSIKKFPEDEIMQGYETKGHFVCKPGLTLEAHEVILKENKFKQTVADRPIIRIIAKDNFDVEDNGFEELSLSFYCSKPHTFNSKSFYFLELLPLRGRRGSAIEKSLYFDDKREANVTFDSCRFSHIFVSEKTNVELNNCEFGKDEEANSFVQMKDLNITFNNCNFVASSLSTFVPDDEKELPACAILFNSCKFFENTTKPSTIKVVNKYIKKLYGSSSSNMLRTTAVKFEYDIDNLPQDLKDKISSTPTSTNVREVLKQFITADSSKDKVGYFLNLGDDEPSNTSPAKFLGNYE